MIRITFFVLCALLTGCASTFESGEHVGRPFYPLVQCSDGSLSSHCRLTPLDHPVFRW